MRLLVATDAAAPQVNGVVRTLDETAAALARVGVQTTFLTPAAFAAAPMPTYPEIRLSFATAGRVASFVQENGFDAIHVATEGPIGMAARRFCLRNGLAFTTSYHTRFPEYLRVRAPIPLAWSYAWLRRFHNAGSATMVSSDSLARELESRGFERLKVWARGVDTALFRPRSATLDLPRPIFLFVGRLAVEKNLPAFLALDLPGTKLVVGDGPQRTFLQSAHPEAVFLGLRTGEDLARIFASADAFVFPSLTDTYGIVLLEALASGVPVAAFPAPGPRDVLAGSNVAVLDHDLRGAALAALRIPRERCRAFALRHSWEESARAFLSHVVPLSEPVSTPRALVLRSAG